MSNEAFETFYRREYPGASRLAYMLVGSKEAGDDLVQDAFLAVERHLGEVRNPGAYLRAAIVSQVSAWHRKNSRRSAIAARIYEDCIVSPEEAELFDVLAALPYRQRAALTLRFWCDLNNAEIADALGCRTGTVKSLISRGLDRLRSELTEFL